jgi:hypothetical protein
MSRSWCLPATEARYAQRAASHSSFTSSSQRHNSGERAVFLSARQSLAEYLVSFVADCRGATREGENLGPPTCFLARPCVSRFAGARARRRCQSLDLIIPDHLRVAHWRCSDDKGCSKAQGRPTLTRALHKSGRRLYVEMTFAIVEGDAGGEALCSGRHGTRRDRTR